MPTAARFTAERLEAPSLAMIDNAESIIIALSSQSAQSLTIGIKASQNRCSHNILAIFIARKCHGKSLIILTTCQQQSIAMIDGVTRTVMAAVNRPGDDDQKDEKSSTSPSIPREQAGL